MAERVELRHFRYFVAVAEELHFGRAAKRLGIAQPPLSITIQRLEAELDVTLFERTSRRVQLTDGGRRLLERCRDILAEVDGVASEVQRAARGETGALTVAFAASVMFLSLPKIVRRFREQFPRVRLELLELPTGPQILALRAGTLDIGFLREPPADPDLHRENMMREPLVLALSKRHRLAARARIKLEDVAHDDFVLFPRDVAPGLYAQVLALCAEAKVTPRVVQTSRELYTTVSLVEAGMGVTIVPASVQKMGWRGIRYIPLKSAFATTHIDAAWRTDNHSPIIPAFLSIARAVG